MSLPHRVTSARRAGVWRRWHRRLALLLSLPLVWLLLTGGLLAVLRPTQPPAAPEPDPQWRAALGFQRPEALAVAVQRIEQRLGPAQRLSLRPPRAADEPIVVRVSAGPWHGQVLAAPLSGEPYAWVADADDPGRLLLELHHSLALPEPWDGVVRNTLAAAGALALAALLAGLGLWLSQPAGSRRAAPPGVPGQCRPPGRDDARRHQRLGLLLALPLLLLLLTGAWMGAKPVASWVSHWAGSAAPRVPPVRLQPGQPRAPLPTLWQAAHAALPGGRVGYLILSERATEPVRVRLRMADEPHPNGLSSVWLHPQTAQVLQATSWRQLDLGSRITNWAYPLHSGWLLPRWLPPLWAAVAVGALPLLFTGLRPWWQRRRQGRCARPAAAAAAAATARTTSHP